jgi:alkenylglycerophosphocholine/alkenylglycerophosphoethanolamine hydrolase
MVALAASRRCQTETPGPLAAQVPGTVRPVTAAALVALVIAGLLAAGDWYSRWRDNAPLEYVCKPGTLVALIAAATLLDPDTSAVRAWFVAALALSLVGDVLLMLPKEQFVGGLAAFLLAHICFIGGFVADGLPGPAFALSLAGTAVVLAPVARRVLRGVQANEPALRPPVVAYLVVIGVMLAAAVASGNTIAAVGAVLFVTSDSMIAWSKFVAPVDAAPVAIMVTYHLAQAGFVLSLLR